MSGISRPGSLSCRPPGEDQDGHHQHGPGRSIHKQNSHHDSSERVIDDLSRFCCLNAQCLYYRQQGAGNLSVTSRYGLNKQRRMLRCRTCKTRFSERKGTLFFDSRLPDEKAVTLLEHIAEGCGVRQSGRLCKVNRNTVLRYRHLTVEHHEPQNGESTGKANDQEWSSGEFGQG